MKRSNINFGVISRFKGRLTGEACKFLDLHEISLATFKGLTTGTDIESLFNEMLRK